MPSDRPLIVIVGPTAAGKTRVAIDVAKALPGGAECVCADSMQVYREMDIGTAKPSPGQRAEVPHHLLDLADPASDGFSVDTWLDLAETAIGEIRGRGRWAIVVGGTNLYVQALLEGLLDGPGPSPDLRRRLAALDGPGLRAWLERVDPAAAERIHPNDRKRTVRAIEVFELSGLRVSDLQRQWHQGPRGGARRGAEGGAEGEAKVAAKGGAGRDDVRIIGLDWPVPLINRRINDRVREMVAAGLEEEVHRLWSARRLGRQAREALGYKQVIDALEGRRSREEAVEEIKIRTRRFAKQQRTWLRRFRRHRRATWLPASELSHEDLVKQALAAILDPSDPVSDPSPIGPGPSRDPAESP